MADDETPWYLRDEFDEDVPEDPADDPVFDAPEDFTVWRTKDGRRIRLTEMTSGHLRRTIQVLRGKSPIGTTYRTTPARRIEWVQAMAAELQRRGEPLPAVRSLSSST